MFLAVVALALAPHVAATTVEPLDDRALVERSDLIARIVVKTAHAERVGRRIITFYEVDVVDAWHSKDAGAPARVTVGLPGGVVGGIGQVVPGTPILEVGKQYVLCLGDDTGPKGARAITGLWLGAFSVVESAGVAVRLRPFTHAHAGAGDQEPVDVDVDERALRARFGIGGRVEVTR